MYLCGRRVISILVVHCPLAVMLRTKATVCVEVKRVIGALSRLLAATGLEDVPAPETFRRAKFGGGLQVEDQFWQLLANILQRAGIVSSEAHAQIEGEHRQLVVAGLWQTGYYADWLYGRESGRFLSRELLLALGWLLATAVLEKLLRQRVQQFDKTLLTPTPMNPQLSSELQFDSTALRKLQWLIGCLRHQGHTLLSMQEERTGLLHAVLFAILSSSVSSSAQSSTVLRKDCVCMRQLCDLLEAYLNWKQVESIFWTWMDSVLDCHLTDAVLEKPTHARNRSARVCHHGNQGLEKLEDMLLKLPTGQLMSQKGQRRGRGDAKERSDVRERLPEGSAISSLPPYLSSPLSLPSLPIYQVRLQTERPVKHSRHPAAWPRSEVEAPDKLSSSQTVQLLLQSETLLLERRDRQRLANRMQLQEMIGRVDELVLIQP